MERFAVTAIGRDRPGIVAAISAELLELGGNVEDSRMSILGGHFAVMLIVALPETAGGEELSRRMTGVAEELGLSATSVSPVHELAEERARPTHVLSVYGADHPGIVSAVAGALAKRGASITDLQTQVSGAPERPLYVMLMEIAAGSADVEEIRAALKAIGDSEELEVGLNELGDEAI